MLNTRRELFAEKLLSLIKLHDYIQAKKKKKIKWIL